MKLLIVSILATASFTAFAGTTKNGSCGIVSAFQNQGSVIFVLLDQDTVSSAYTKKSDPLYLELLKDSFKKGTRVCLKTSTYGDNQNEIIGVRKD